MDTVNTFYEDACGGDSSSSEHPQHVVGHRRQISDMIEAVHRLHHGAGSQP